MRRLKLKVGRPSPSMAVALAALVIGVAGVAMAAPTAINSVLNKKEKKQTRNIAKNQINKLAPGLTVARAGRADKADDADALGGQPLGNISVARSATPGGQCDPTSTAFVNCATVDLTLPHEGRVLLVGTAGNIAFNNANASGDCLFRVDGVNSGGSVHVGNQSLPNVTGAGARAFPDGFANTVVTAPVPAGAHTFGIACSEANADIEFQGPQISAVLVGSG